MQSGQRVAHTHQKIWRRRKTCPKGSWTRFSSKLRTLVRRSTCSGQRLEEYKEFVENTKDEKAQWLSEVPEELKPLNEKLNGPLLERIATDVCFRDTTFVTRTKYGFDLIGDMEPC